jgi:hypothetical protein
MSQGGVAFRLTRMLLVGLTSRRDVVGPVPAAHRAAAQVLDGGVFAVEVSNGEGQEGTGTFCCANTSMTEGLDGRAGPMLCVGSAQGSTISGPARARGCESTLGGREMATGPCQSPTLWVRTRPIPLAGAPRPGAGDHQPMRSERGGATCPYRHRETGT